MLLPPLAIIQRIALQCGEGANKGDMKKPFTLYGVQYTG